MSEPECNLLTNAISTLPCSHVAVCGGLEFLKRLVSETNTTYLIIRFAIYFTSFSLYLAGSIVEEQGPSFVRWVC